MPKILLIVLTLLLLGAACSKQPSTNNADVSPTNQSASSTNQSETLTAADQAGKQISRRCTGVAKPKLANLPMRLEDFSMILPYGLMVGGHVTPIDHQYFSPTVFNSAPGTYDVYAMADSRIVDIGTRQHPGQGSYKNQTVTDYRLVFMISCRLFYYYDLVNSLAPDILAEFTTKGREIDLPVKAGQVIGKIGNQTLDFAVWDTDKPLTGFINPASYSGENWKLYTADPLDYYPDEMKAAAQSKYPRTAEPRSGKIDDDVDGKLIGTWFQVGTNGYAGPGGGVAGYWNGHLALAPDYLDPTKFVVSVGNWPGGASQFAVIDNTPDPNTVGVETGVVKFELAPVNYRDGNGGWDRTSLPTAITMIPGIDVEGCFLAQLTDTRVLKAEAFDGKRCSQVSGFTAAAVMYER